MFASSVITMTFFAVAFFGAMLLFPLYFILVREQSALHAGLLLAPQGLGAMVTMPIAGRLADKVGVRKLVMPGLALIIVGMAIFTQIEADTSYWQIMGTLFLMGLGMGFTMMPIMTAALQTLTHQDAQRSTTLNIVQQTAGAIGTAVMSVVLTNQVLGYESAKLYSGVTQGLLDAAKVPPQVLLQGRIELGHAFGHTYIVALVLTVLCLIRRLLPRKRIEAATPAPIVTH